MRLKKRLILANASTVIIPLIITVLVALAAFFIYGKLIGNEKTIENYQRESMIKFELIKEANALSRTPELIGDEGFHQYFKEKMSGIGGEYALIKDEQLIYSSQKLSKIDLAKCLEAGKNITKREPVMIDKQSYTVQVIDLEFNDGSHGNVLLLEPLKEGLVSLVTLLVIILIVFIMVFVLTNIIVSYQFSRSIIRPLLSLQSAAAEITKGNLDYPIVEEGDYEIQALCRELEIMRIKLKDSVHTQLKYEENRKVLISSISHDLKTPVTSIKGYVEGILDGIASNPDKLERYLKTIAVKTHQVDQMIDDLLLYAKLDMKQLPYNFQSLDIEQFVLHCLLENEPELERKHIKISLHNELKQNQDVLIDRERMKRVIMNIFDNSHKYMNKDEGKIDVYLRETIGSVIIEFRDNGSGVGEGDLPRIFDRFFRSDPARSKGSGLGLAIAKQIIEGHSGRVWAVGHGTEGTSIMISLCRLS